MRRGGEGGAGARGLRLPHRVARARAGCPSACPRPRGGAAASRRRAASCTTDGPQPHGRAGWHAWLAHHGWLSHSYPPLQLVLNSVHKCPKPAPRCSRDQSVYTPASPRPSRQRNSVHKCPETAPRGRFRRSVYTPASPRLLAPQKCCQESRPETRRLIAPWYTPRRESGARSSEGHHGRKAEAWRSNERCQRL